MTRAYAALDPDAADALGRRRHETAARRLAAVAAYSAASVHAAFADRPGLDDALRRAVADAWVRARRPAFGCASALGAVATAALALPVTAEEEDWQLHAIAYADEALLRDLYEACVTLAGSALQVLQADA
jgi:hypothetical protein